jgi:hypothetical protein
MRRGAAPRHRSLPGKCPGYWRHWSFTALALFWPSTKEETPVKHSLAAAALLLVASGTAEAADRCGRATAPVGGGKVELSLRQRDRGASFEHALLEMPSRDDSFVMLLTYRPAGGRIGTIDWVQVFAFAPWARQVGVGEYLGIKADRGKWLGLPRITGLSSRSGRKGSAAEYLVAGDQVRADPALLGAFAAGGEVRLARGPARGPRIEAEVELPGRQALDTAYQAARRQAAAALAPCSAPSVQPVSAP